MKNIYLGDSYDLVKRFLHDSLEPVAPLYAHPEFVPPEIRTDYTKVTTIPIFDDEQPPRGDFGLLLDPDTGIPLPKALKQKTSRAHAALKFIVEINEEFHPKYMICFDQSHHRIADFSKPEQRESKMKVLKENGLNCFYYVSHAPFLFIAEDSEVLAAMRRQLMEQGIPSKLIQSLSTVGN